MDAYARASVDGVRPIVLSFAQLEYMNSGGIGLLVMLLVRAHRNGEQVLAYGLSDHYRQIFELTRLDEAVGIHADERDALAAVGNVAATLARRLAESHRRRRIQFVEGRLCRAATRAAGVGKQAGVAPRGVLALADGERGVDADRERQRDRHPQARAGPQSRSAHVAA